MDPVGPWSAYASYNLRAGVQAGTASGDFHHHLATSGSGLSSSSTAVPTTSQLLLQAAHTTASLAGQLGSSTAPPFNPGGFLSPAGVGYDMFSPLFHHPNPKPAHYNAATLQQHRQVIAAAASKQSSVESEISTLRENYSSHQGLAQGSSFFDQSSASTGGSALAWQGNNQLPSPFGILPHESVVPSASSPATTKASSSYDNFNPQFSGTQSVNNHLNPTLNSSKGRSGSPAAQTKSTSSTSSTFYQTPATYGSGTDSVSSYSTTTAKSSQISSQQDYPGSKSYSSSGNNVSAQPSCIVSTPVSSTTTAAKDYRPTTVRTSISTYSPQSNQSSIEKSPRHSNSSFTPPTSKPPSQQIQTKAQAKIYPDITSETRRLSDNISEQPQSSPISYSMVDTSTRSNYTCSAPVKCSKGSHPTQYSNTSAPIRHYHSGNNVEADYVRVKSSSSTDTGYSSSSSQNGPDCAVTPRRPSPLHASSQASPLGQSPAYPMYNSPMNSLSSPQQHPESSHLFNKSSLQVPPHSPRDPIRPPSQNSQVAYSSVITRALGSEHNRYDRAQTQSALQNCWDNDRQRKYTTASNGSITDSSTRNTSLSSSSQRTVEKSYFDSPVPLHDLSSCRGDPMSIVKNLQSNQQSCQVQEQKNLGRLSPPTNVTKQTTHRKSIDKGYSNLTELASATMDYLSGRIPPPAHSSSTNQTQQNGTYFDFERWNIPPTAKMFSGSPALTTNFGNQHQTLGVPHAPPLPYFTPFHLATHPDYPPSVELSALPPLNETMASTPSSACDTREEEQSKVVVPNIEEELGFLAEGRANASSVASQQQQPTNNMAQEATKKINIPVTGPGSGFMASYLKFLQGERDTSPPPVTRGARKTNWTRTTPTNTTNNKAFTPNENKIQSDSTQQNTNGAMAASVPVIPGMNPASASTPTGVIGSNPMHSSLMGSMKPSEVDDPRYYNMNKDRKRKYDGESTYDDDEARRLNKPVLNVPTTPLNDKNKKGRGAMNKPPPVAAPPPQPAVPKKPRVPQPPIMQGQPQQQYYYQQPDEASGHTGAGLDYYNDDKKQQQIKGGGHQQITSTSQQPIPRPQDEMPYQAGEFVAIKSEMNDPWPSIWRVDGKTLLQKYEPFEQNGKVLYRNISTYAAWNPDNKKLYTQVPVRIRSQSHLESIVELVRSELPMDDAEIMEKRMQETMLYQENFEVYVQTLISHALDPNFLTEIFQEQDEYFLTNVKTIDEITESVSIRIRSACGAAYGALATWPGLSVASVSGGECRACGRPAVARLLLYGQPYNPGTLEPAQPDARHSYEKEIPACMTCCGRLQLYSRLVHQKYLMFAECSKRVADKRITQPHKDTTVILNELLADEAWLSQVFRDVRKTWAEAEVLDRKLRQGMSRQLH